MIPAAAFGFAAGVTVTLIVVHARRAVREAIPPVLRVTTRLSALERETT